jgi:L-amino acid N-acyltransferase YncA
MLLKINCKQETISKTALLQLLNTHFVLESDEHPFTLDFLEEKQNIYLSYDYDDTLTGICFFSRIHYKGAYSKNANLNIYVPKPYRNKGIATKLWSFLKTHEKVADFKNIITTCFASQNATKNWLQQQQFHELNTLKDVLVEDKYHDVVFYNFY